MRWKNDRIKKKRERDKRRASAAGEASKEQAPPST